MSLLKKFFQKEEKRKGGGCCTFNLDAEIEKARDKKNTCCR